MLRDTEVWKKRDGGVGEMEVWSGVSTSNWCWTVKLTILPIVEHGDKGSRKKV